MAMAEITTEVPHGTARRFDLRTGDLIRIETLDGAQGGDFSFPGFDQALTRNKLGWKRFGRPWLVYDAQAGDSLFDVDGEATFELIALEGEGVADIMYPGCWDEVYEDRRPGCQDLISAALTIPRRDLAGMLSFFIGYSAGFRAEQPSANSVSTAPPRRLTAPTSASPRFSPTPGPSLKFSRAAKRAAIFSTARKLRPGFRWVSIRLLPPRARSASPIPRAS